MVKLNLVKYSFVYLIFLIFLHSINLTCSYVMQCVNGFLANNPKLRVYRCETLESTTDFNGRFDGNKTVHIESAEGWRIFVRGLRLWCVDTHEVTPQQLWYLNLMPETKKQEGYGLSGFEGITKTMERLNAFFEKYPIPGSLFYCVILQISSKCSRQRYFYQMTIF